MSLYYADFWIKVNFPASQSAPTLFLTVKERALVARATRGANPGVKWGDFNAYRCFTVKQRVEDESQEKRCRYEESGCLWRERGKEHMS